MGNSVVQKDVLAKYVHDAVEMETAIYTLDESEKECRKRKDDLSKVVEDQWELYMMEKANCKYFADWLKNPSYEDIEGEYPNPPEKPILPKQKKSFRDAFWLTLILGIVGYIPICYALGILVGWILSFTGLEITAVDPMRIVYGVFVVCGILVFLCAIIFGVKSIRKDRKTYEKELLVYEQAVKSYPAQCREIDKKYYNKMKQAYDNNIESVDEYFNDYNNSKKQCQLIDYQIENIVNKRQQIKNNLESFYNYGIIPPDYRTFDCVMMLEHIFRNDLADTMRDAINIYREQVFRGSVIQGMDRICSMLGRLSSEMSAISLRLDMINSSVTQMGDDLLKTNQRLMNNQRELIDESIKNRAATEDLIHETQLGRYTNEKLLESNKRLEYYAQEYRMGRMPRDYMN